MDVTEFLEHHGVRGQKWGIRNERTTKRGNYKLTGKQKVGVGAATVLGSPFLGVAAYAIMKSNGNTRLSVARAASGNKKATHHIVAKHGSASMSTATAKLQADQDHLTKVHATAVKDPKSLILLNGQVVTGAEFRHHVENGGLVNPARTRVYAQQENGQGPYVMK